MGLMVAGQSCDITDNDGSYTVTCPDSDPVTIRDGIDGDQGPQGEPGTDGDPGANGQSIAVPYPMSPRASTA